MPREGGLPQGEHFASCSTMRRLGMRGDVLLGEELLHPLDRHSRLKDADAEIGDPFGTMLESWGPRARKERTDLEVRGPCDHASGRATLFNVKGDSHSKQRQCRECDWDRERFLLHFDEAPKRR